jgi:hypothetical protein
VKHSGDLIDPAHLLLEPLRQEEGAGPALVTKVAGSPATLSDEIEQELNKHPRVGGGEAQVESRARRPVHWAVPGVDRWAIISRSIRSGVQ